MKLGGKFTINDYAIQQTEMLLDTEGIQIKLVRGAAWEDDGAGGVIKPDNELDVDVPVQTFFFCTYDDGERFIKTPILGDLRSNRYVLVGLPDANMEAKDTFTIDDEDYQIEFVRTEDNFQKLGEVIRLGGKR